MMDVEMKVTKPEEVNVTLTITATMAKWQEIHDLFGKTYSYHPLMNAIWEATVKLRNNAIVAVDDAEEGA